jgi:hypothetical protein
MAGITKKGDVYYALFSVDGKTKWKRIGIMPYKGALRVLKDMEARFEKEKVGLKELKPRVCKPLASSYASCAKKHWT